MDVPQKKRKKSGRVRNYYFHRIKLVYRWLFISYTPLINIIVKHLFSMI
jgi:hypothetical protein